MSVLTTRSASPGSPIDHHNLTFGHDPVDLPESERRGEFRRVACDVPVVRQFDDMMEDRPEIVRIAFKRLGDITCDNQALVLARRNFTIERGLLDPYGQGHDGERRDDREG